MIVTLSIEDIAKDGYTIVNQKKFPSAMIEDVRLDVLNICYSELKLGLEKKLRERNERQANIT